MSLKGCADVASQSTIITFEIEFIYAKLLYAVAGWMLIQFVNG